MSQKKCRAIYEARLATWAAARSPALRVAYQNAPFTPATGETFLRVHQIPAATQSADLAGTLRTWLGLIQIDIMAPINAGSGAALGIADELGALFVHNARLSTTGLTVQQTAPVSVGPALQDEAHFQVPASFSYRADT